MRRSASLGDWRRARRRCRPACGRSSYRSRRCVAIANTWLTGSRTMPSMAGGWQRFQECGWPSWLSLLLGLVGFGLSITALVFALFGGRARVPVAWLALAVALVPS